MRRRVALVVALVVAGAGVVAVGVARGAGCAAPAAGGEWRIYGHDLSNTRNQNEEHAIGPQQAKQLRPAFVATAAEWGGAGDFNNTPIVADGCLYMASNAGWVFAADASNGTLVWRTQLEDSVLSTPAVAGGRVFITVDRADFPYVVALDQATGALLWRVTVDKQPGSEIMSSAVPYAGLVLVGVSGAGAESGTTATGNPQSRLNFRGTYLFLDQATGAIVRKGYVIPDADFADGRPQGFSGGGIWSTFAVDPETNYAYVGAGNPFGWAEHPHTNSILKVDVDRARPTFGQIVGNYHGTIDQYFDALSKKPICKLYMDVFTCELMDYDFGASPQLFTDANGRKLVGALQKASVYHAADRSTMAGVWETVVGGPFGMLGGMSTASFDGQSLLVAGNFPGVMNGLDPASGRRRWLSPIVDGIHYQSVSSANGVTYNTDSNGLLRMWGSQTGKLLQARLLFRDAGTSPGSGLSGAGITIARNTVYVPVSGGALVAYR